MPKFKLCTEKGPTPLKMDIYLSFTLFRKNEIT